MEAMGENRTVDRIWKQMGDLCGEPEILKPSNPVSETLIQLSIADPKRVQGIFLCRMRACEVVVNYRLRQDCKVVAP